MQKRSDTGIAAKSRQRAVKARERILHQIVAFRDRADESRQQAIDRIGVAAIQRRKRAVIAARRAFGELEIVEIVGLVGSGRRRASRHRGLHHRQSATSRPAPAQPPYLMFVPSGMQEAYWFASG